jgi:spermidine synthase
MVADSESKQVGPVGRHLVLDYWDCEAELLDDKGALIQIINDAAEAAGAQVLSTEAHQFDGQGVTAVSVLAESHISIHTWPEFKYAGVDIYTCGVCDPMLAHALIKERLASSRVKLVELRRGEDDSFDAINARSDVILQRSASAGNQKWFFEDSVPGRRNGKISHGFAIEEVVVSERTAFQEYSIFDSRLYGRVLALDGIVQFSTTDEYIYHEMLVHPAMFSHPNPKRVLIVGGGDGAALREVLRHNPDQVVMIDIDEQFVRGAAAHLPSLNAGAFDDPRLELLFEDASTALPRFENCFDLAIIDCNDAVGASEPLFKESFYASVARSLRAGALCSVQAGSMLDTDFLTQTRQRISAHLGSADCFKLTIPSYHCGEYIFMVASKSQDLLELDAATLAKRQSQRGIETKYWSPAMHHASQVFPPGSSLSKF